MALLAAVIEGLYRIEKQQESIAGSLRLLAKTTAVDSAIRQGGYTTLAVAAQLGKVFSGMSVEEAIDEAEKWMDGVCKSTKIPKPKMRHGVRQWHHETVTILERYFSGSGGE